MQEKMDGVRNMIRRADSEVFVSNRKGLLVAAPQPIIDGILASPAKELVLDGERIGDKFYAFDLLEFNGQEIRSQPALKRYDELVRNFIKLVVDVPSLEIVPTAIATHEKKYLWQLLKDRSAEGAVFKRKDATYIPGRPASGGNQLKHKFTKTCTCFVRSLNEGKRSVALGMEDGDKLVGVGNVTIPVNFDVPNEGDLVEVRYLYAFPGGSLFQPVYLGSREGELDKADDVSILVFKQGTADEDDA